MNLKGKRIAILAEDLYEDQELWYPYYRLLEEGAEVRIVGPGAKTYTSKHGYPVQAEVAASESRASEFDAVVIPGGYAPDKLRRYPSVLKLVRGIYEQGKIVAAICHAGSVLISAGIVRGHKATGSVGIRDDLVNAGAEWVDVPAIRDGNLVFGRVVEDIPAFCRELVKALGE